MADEIHILVAEDEAHIREGLCATLESEGYRVTAVADGAAALAALHAGRFDLVMLDVMMPISSGFDVCRQLRKADDRTPVMMLTAKSEEIDKVVGLKLGADDYLTKPFGIHELLARVAALLRRAGLGSAPADAGRPFALGLLSVEPQHYRARRGEETIRLTARELALLSYFFDNPSRVLKRDELLDAVWGQTYMGTTRTLDQHIAQLRKKVERDPALPCFIITVHGVGYQYLPGE